MSIYLFDNAAPPAGERVTSLEHCYDKATIANLEALGVGEAWQCLEVGGGNGSVAHWLADRIGPTGKVVATDINVSLMRPPVSNLEIDPARVELFHKVTGGMHELLRQAGMDSAWARTAYTCFTQSGYTDLGYRGFCDAWRGGSVGANLHRANALRVADQLIANGLATRGRRPPEPLLHPGSVEPPGVGSRH